MQAEKYAIIADDDKETLRSLVQILEEDQFNVILAFDTRHAYQLIEKHQPKLIISEVAKINYDGISLFKQLCDTPKPLKTSPKIIALTNNNEELYEIKSFDFGIDDYLHKPLRKEAFKKRLGRFFKSDRVEKKAVAEEFQIRDLYFDLKNKSLYKLPQREKVEIQFKSFEILHFLAAHPNKIFNREQLLEGIWHSNKKITARSVDVHILKIRQLLGKDYITTVKGVGYLFKQ